MFAMSIDSQIRLCGEGECMCELGEFDETSRVQKKYNLLSWYLVAAIIFYAIPAYQLVTTYQQVTTLDFFRNEGIMFVSVACYG